MDVEQAGQAALQYLTEQATVREPLIQAILDTRHCLGPFRLYASLEEFLSLELDATQPLRSQLFLTKVAALQEDALLSEDSEEPGAAPIIDPILTKIRDTSLRLACHELTRQARLLVFPERNQDRMFQFPRRYRSIGPFDYEVPRAAHPKLYPEFENSQANVAAIFDWPEPWDSDWLLEELELCSRLRMLVVRAFCGDAYLIARRESESADSPRRENNPKRLEWPEKFPSAERSTLTHVHTVSRDLIQA
jgi:hypothetical protein